MKADKHLGTIVTLLAVALVLTAVLWVARAPAPSNNAARLPFTGIDRRLVTIDTPQRRDFSIRLQWYGQVESKERIWIVPLLAGRIASLGAIDEKPVTKGTLLFSLDGPSIQDSLKTTQAEIASLSQRVGLAKELVAIQQELVGDRFAGKEDLYAAKDDLLRLQADLTRFEQQLSSLHEQTQLRAMRDGIFTSRRVSVGQEVMPGDTLAALIPPRSVRVVAHLFPPPHTPLNGRSATVALGEGATETATVTAVLPRRTRDGATVVWIEGPSLDSCLAPGETVSGCVITTIHENVLAVPRDAIIRDQNERAFVFVVTPQGYAKRPLRTGYTSDQWVEVIKGVAETDSVVTRGAYELYYRDFNRVYKVED